MKKRRFLALIPWIGVAFIAVIGCNQTKTTAPSTSPVTQNQPITLTVSAAADLKYAFEEIGKLFEQETGNKVTFNFGSTGQLAQQIERGAPIDLFAAANQSFIQELDQKGLIISDTKKLYGRGRITLWTREDSKHNLKDIKDLGKADIKRVAIANPDHAPYGIAAREALQSAGIWEVVQPKLVLGENVRQTQQYAETGNVDAAIVALSLSVLKPGRWELIPDNLHKPLDQMLAVTKKTSHEAQARQFGDFINGDKGRPLMRKYGFVLAGEELSQ